MRRKINFKTILFALLAGISLIFEFYFGIISGVGFVIQVILIAITFTFLLRIFPKNRTKSFSETFSRTFFGILATLGFFFSLFFLFTGYYTIFPGKLSDIVISNGKQKIVFLEMSHIATHDFYSKKRSSIHALAKNSFTFLIEGVRPGTDESHARFNELLGMNFDQNLYPALAAVAGLEVQSGGFLFAGIPLDTIKNVDMSMDEIASLIGSGSSTLSGNLGSMDIGSEINLISNLSREEQNFIRYVFRSFLNWSIVSMTDVEHLTLADNVQLFDIILRKRNEKIIDYIRNNPQKNIVVVYGALHFSGILEALKLHDKNWKIVSYTSDTPYSE